MDSRAVPRPLKSFVHRVLSEFGPAQVILFGSRARGDAHPNSDYDLIVVSVAFKCIRFYDRHVRIYTLLPWNIDVDVICLTPEEFEARSKSLSIIAEAAREGVELTA